MCLADTSSRSHLLHPQLQATSYFWYIHVLSPPMILLFPSGCGLSTLPQGSTASTVKAFTVDFVEILITRFKAEACRPFVSRAHQPPEWLLALCTISSFTPFFSTTPDFSSVWHILFSSFNVFFCLKFFGFCTTFVVHFFLIIFFSTK